ncbi:hypothetical protein BGX23_002378 [Mortierella sp. AD031]|nr:hypothetical protein BGX23_002378 [Mortierella sp. AD031]
MVLHEESLDELVQTVRPVHKDNLFPTTPAAVAQVATHFDASCGKNIILWDDILQAFKDALHPRHGIKILPFHKDSAFNNLCPLRFTAIPGAILDIVVDGQVTSTNPAPPHSMFQQIATQASYFLPLNPIDRLRPVTLPSSSNPSAGSHSHYRSDTQIVSLPPFGHHGRALTHHAQPRIPLKKDVKEIIRSIAAHVDLAALQEKGEGDAKDFLKTLTCYLNAVRRGHAHAQLCVGDLYAQGREIAQDSTRAFEWYLKAASQGDATAQRKIAFLIQPASPFGLFPCGHPEYLSPGFIYYTNNQFTTGNTYRDTY